MLLQGTWLSSGDRVNHRTICRQWWGHPVHGTYRPSVPPTELSSHFSQLYLLAFCSLEVNVAVALPTLGRGPELPEPMSLGSLG